MVRVFTGNFKYLQKDAQKELTSSFEGIEQTYFVPGWSEFLMAVLNTCKKDKIDPFYFISLIFFIQIEYAQKELTGSFKGIEQTYFVPGWPEFLLEVLNTCKKDKIELWPHTYTRVQDYVTWRANFTGDPTNFAPQNGNNENPAANTNFAPKNGNNYNNDNTTNNNYDNNTNNYKNNNRKYNDRRDRERVRQEGEGREADETEQDTNPSKKATVTI